MTYLELVNSVVELADISNSPLATVQGVSGINLRAKNWVKQSWIDIQNLHTDWLFLRQNLSFVTASSQSYTLAAMGAPLLRSYDKESLRIYQTSAGVADEQRLTFMEWQDFRDTYLYGPRQTGRPICFSIDPAVKTLWLSSNPGTGFTVTGYYRTSPVTLSADADTPACPAEYHMIVVYRALLKYAGFEAAQEVKQEAKENYGPLLSNLRIEQLPQFGLAGSL